MSIGAIVPGGVISTKVSGASPDRNIGSPDGSSSEGSADVSRSHFLQFIQDLKDDAGRMPTVRSDLVDQAKADIASGSLGTDEDLNATINALLAGF